MMNAKRTSIQPTYDSRETGPRYWVTSTIDSKPVVFRERVEDPFVRHTIHVGWRDLLRALIARRGMKVEVSVGGDTEVVEDVLELDNNFLGFNCTRRDEFNQGINDAIGAFAADQGDEVSGR